MTKVNAAITFDGKWFVARCLNLPVTSQGSSLEEAKLNLAEAVELYVETWGLDDLESSIGEPELAKLEVSIWAACRMFPVQNSSKLCGRRDSENSGKRGVTFLWRK